MPQYIYEIDEDDQKGKRVGHRTESKTKSGKKYVFMTCMNNFVSKTRYSFDGCAPLNIDFNRVKFRVANRVI